MDYEGTECSFRKLKCSDIQAIPVCRMRSSAVYYSPATAAVHTCFEDAVGPVDCNQGAGTCGAGVCTLKPLCATEQIPECFERTTAVYGDLQDVSACFKPAVPAVAPLGVAVGPLDCNHGAGTCAAGVCTLKPLCADVQVPECYERSSWITYGADMNTCAYMDYTMKDCNQGAGTCSAGTCTPKPLCATFKVPECFERTSAVYGDDQHTCAKMDMTYEKDCNQGKGTCAAGFCSDKPLCANVQVPECYERTAAVYGADQHTCAKMDVTGKDCNQGAGTCGAGVCTAKPPPCEGANDKKGDACSTGGMTGACDNTGDSMTNDDNTGETMILFCNTEPLCSNFAWGGDNDHSEGCMEKDPTKNGVHSSFHWGCGKNVAAATACTMKYNGGMAGECSHGYCNAIPACKGKTNGDACVEVWSTKTGTCDGISTGTDSNMGTGTAVGSANSGYCNTAALCSTFAWGGKDDYSDGCLVHDATKDTVRADYAWGCGKVADAGTACTMSWNNNEAGVCDSGHCMETS